MSAQLKPIAGPMPLTDEWHALRLFDPERKERPILFGASDSAKACALSPYGGPLDLFLEATGRKARFAGNEATEAGNDFEPVVLNIYERRTSTKLIRQLPMYLSPKHFFMGATPDALVVNDDSEWQWGVDAKTTTYKRYDFDGENENKYGREGTDQLPIDGVLQAQQQMEVLGLDRVDFPVLFDIRTTRIYRVERNEDLIKMIISAEKELAERIINDDPPEPNWSHPNTKQNLRDLFGFTPAKTIELDDETAERWLEVQKLKVQRDNLEKQIEEHKNRILFALQDAQVGQLPGGQKVLKRSVVKTSYWGPGDIENATASQGQVKRAGHERLLEGKVK